MNRRGLILKWETACQVTALFDSRQSHSVEIANHPADMIRLLSSFCGCFFFFWLFLFHVVKDESASVSEVSLHGYTSRWRQRVCLEWPWWKLKPCRTTFIEVLCSARAVSIHTIPIFCLTITCSSPHFPVIGTQKKKTLTGHTQLQT